MNLKPPSATAADLFRLKRQISVLTVDNKTSKKYVSRGTTRTAFQSTTGVGLAALVAWIYLEVSGREMPTSVALVIAGALITGVTFVQRQLERRGVLKVQEEVATEDEG